MQVMELKTIFSWFGHCFGPSIRAPVTTLPPVTLDTRYMGNDVVLIKNGSRICGTGGALATAAIHQDKAYFEAKVQSDGTFGIGLTGKDANLDKASLTNDSWILWSTGKITHGGCDHVNLPSKVNEGDIIGVSFDHTDLKFYLNGEEVGQLTRGAAGHFPPAPFPVVFVDDGAILDVHFSSFAYEPPIGFNGILQEQTLL